jgi:hypothetical protein
MVTGQRDRRSPPYLTLRHLTLGAVLVNGAAASGVYREMRELEHGPAVIT